MKAHHQAACQAANKVAADRDRASHARRKCVISLCTCAAQQTYDRHHVQHERIYRVATEFKANGRSELVALASGLLGPMLAGDYEEERRTMLEGGVWRDGEVIFEGLAMNDVVVSRGATASMVELRVMLGEELVTGLRADGLIVGSPTGSTAYALSAGGPILHPGIAAWVLVPIAPHDLSNRPIVLPDAGEISIEIVAGRDASVNFDMQSLASLLHGDCVTVRRSAHQVRFLHPLGWSYYATLRGKLRWNAGTSSHEG